MKNFILLWDQPIKKLSNNIKQRTFASFEGAKREQKHSPKTHIRINTGYKKIPLLRSLTKEE